MNTANKRDITAARAQAARTEEDVDYTAEYDALYDDDFLDEGEIEHASIRELVDQLEAMHPDDDLYDNITRCELLERHIRDDEYEVFPLAKKANNDSSALGKRLLKQKIELMDELALADELADDFSDSDGSKKKAKWTQGRAA